MDEVKVVLGPRPVLVKVINLKAAVWRHPAGLDGREIRADNMGVGVFVCELNGKLDGLDAEVLWMRIARTIPVPVPRSRNLAPFFWEIGARTRAPLVNRSQTWCIYEILEDEVGLN